MTERIETLRKAVIVWALAVIVLLALVALLFVPPAGAQEVSGPGWYADWLALTPACWSYVEVYAEAGHGVTEVGWTVDNVNWYQAIPGGWWLEHVGAIELYSETAHFDVQLEQQYCEQFLPLVP